MIRRDIKRWTGLTLVILIVLVGATPQMEQFFSIPGEFRMFHGDMKTWDFKVPVTATASVSNPDVVQVNGTHAEHVHVNLIRPFQLFSKKLGEAHVKLKLFGSLPVKTFKVQVIPDVKVVPGGQSIGVKVYTDGMLVLGHYYVKGAEGDISPAQQADVRVGDRIVTMDGKELKQPNDVHRLVQQAGKDGRPLDVELVRKNKKIKVQVKPVRERDSKAYQLGMYIRNATTGVGTLTFIDPQQKIYGALGHVISDVDTGQPIALGKGKIVTSNVTAIEKGASGKPGEKRAIFFNENNVLGTIDKNSRFGIFGQMVDYPHKRLTRSAIPVALAEEVKEGPAHIYTVVEGQKVEKYDIEIVNVIQQKYAATKGMIIKVTDDRLIEKTGGIVQGMSGSPIIQDGKLVGAVTHVFVNDPTSGYGTFIEWMLQEAGIPLNGKQKIGAYTPDFFVEV